MASFKQVTLKDPVTGEYLSPRVYGALEYEVVEDGEVTPPYDMNADTLQGHPASDFLLKSEYTPVDLSEYLKTDTADTKYAAANHNHNGVYAPASHTHTTANITGLDSKLSGYDTEIASLKSSVSNGKSAVASAITDKGVSTSATASFNTMAANIRKISSKETIRLHASGNGLHAGKVTLLGYTYNGNSVIDLSTLPDTGIELPKYVCFKFEYPTSSPSIIYNHSVTGATKVWAYQPVEWYTCSGDTTITITVTYKD